jgi:HAE1 family hydrophobic/amphiphilic exporter-1
MRTLAATCIQRPVYAAMNILALVVVGASSFFRLGLDRFPAVDLPTVMVRTTLPGASVEEIESEVSDVIEEAANRVEGISELRSISSPGTSMVIVTFNLERDIDSATQDVRDRVAAVLRRLPNDVDPPIISKQDSDRAPVLSVAVTGDRTPRELTEIADKLVRVQLERSTGVGEVSLVGGLQRSVNIWVEAERLAAYQLPISQVRSALQQQNADVPGGNVTSDAREQTLRTMGRYTDVADFNDLVIATRGGAPIRVRDIGYAEDGTREVRSYARVNGQPTVILDVRRQSGANTVEVVEAAKASLDRVRPQLPEGVEVRMVRDTSQYIYAALHEIDLHLVLGSILACLVVFAFMRNWRATVIAAVAIPASVISTFGLMAALDFTLNTVTMLALVLMIGIVIDDAIVVLENIFRFIEEKQATPFEAAREATAEIALPVMATTLCLVVIFIPVSFMSSISGRFLYQFGITAASAILISLLVSFTLTPMMSARMFHRETEGGHDDAARSRQGLYGLVDRFYSRVLGWALGHRPVVAAVGLLVMASTYPLYHLVRQEFLPTGIDEAQFEMQVTAPEGT